MQSDEMGQLKSGNFGTHACGYATQPSGWFHVHWGFPKADLHVENWTLSMTTKKWSDGTTTISAGNGWIVAGGTGSCAAPALTSPLAAATPTSQTIAFNWTPVTGCVFTGYAFRVKTVPTMDTGGVTIVDTSTSLPSLRQTIPSQWNNQDLYWGIMAANAPFGASWSVGQFNIQPGNAVPTDYGYCSDEGQRCAFSGSAQIYYGASDHFVGPLTFSDGVDCNSDVLGDPIPGTPKQCFINGGRPEGSTRCADEDGVCSFGSGKEATVYYGVNGKYNSRTVVITSTACDSSTFGDPFPDLLKSCYYVITGKITTGMKMIISNAAVDGTILESSETSNLGGSISPVAPILILGDDALNKQYRAILSFGTAAVPDNAVITSATLKIRRASQSSASPFGTLGNIAVDIKKGVFSANGALQREDFQAGATRNAALTITSNLANGWYSGALNSSSFPFINIVGVTQFRLRFATDDNNNGVADLIRLYSSDFTTTPAYRPSTGRQLLRAVMAVIPPSDDYARCGYVLSN